MANSLIRLKAREALKLHRDGKYAEALARAIELARANPNSAPALILAGYLHVHASSAAWEERPPGCDEAAYAFVARHRRAAVDAYSAASRIAPNCVMTAVKHAEALAADHRFADAMRELKRVLSMSTSHEDPRVHHKMYDFIGGSGAKGRKKDVLNKASAIMEKLAARINNEIVPIEAAKLLRGDTTVGEVQSRAKLLAETFPYSSRAQLLRVHIELEQGRALDEPLRRKVILLRVLALVSDAAGKFDSSLLIALFHAKVLFALDRFDESESECRRALRIQEPIDPSLDDIPPAVSVPGADCDARVLSLKEQIRVLNKQIIAVAAKWWSSIRTTQHRDRVVSVRVDKLHQHYDGIDKPAAKTISDAVRFHKNQSSWSFFVCPNSSCDGKKFVDTESLWKHIRRKHRDKLWDKLQSILGPLHNESASNDDYLLDQIALCEDSEQYDILNLPRVQDMFESLLGSPSIGIQAEPLVEMRRRKCREGAKILEDIKKKLRMLPKDNLSTKFQKLCFAIKNMWLKLLETSALDHRDVILPLARSFQWIEMKRSIAHSKKDLGGIIGGGNIEALYGRAPDAPDYQSGDYLQSEKLKTSGADDTLKAAEKCEESQDNFAEGELSQEIGSNVSLIGCKSQVMVRILDFRSFSHEFDKNCSIQEIICDAFCKKDVFILDPVVRFNGRNAYLDDKWGFLNPTDARDCTITINPRLRGGRPSRSIAPVLRPLAEYVSLLGDGLFDIITFPQDLYFQGMDPYFVTLGLPAITIAVLLFLLLESYHAESKCVSRYALRDLVYDSTSKRLLFTDTVWDIGFTKQNYDDNMYDAGSVLSSIFMFDELRVLAGVSTIHIPVVVGVANPHWRHPKLVELLIHDLQTGVRTFPGVAVDKRKRAYFRRHEAVMTTAERLSFWLTSELHFEFRGGEKEFDRYLGITHIPPWKHKGFQSAAFGKLLTWRTYKDNLLGDQWSSGRNWLSHAKRHTNGQISEKQAEAYLHMLFEFLFYYVLLKITFPTMLIKWNARPLPLPRCRPPQPTYLVQTLPGQPPLKVSNSFELEELLDPSGSLRM